MKIKVKREKIIKAVKSLQGIELVLESSEDAKEAVNLVLAKPGLFKSIEGGKLKDIQVTPVQEYKTSAVDYEVMFLLEFLFEDQVALEEKVAVIKELQEFFDKL
jgi:hypothetical protein